MLLTSQIYNLFGELDTPKKIAPAQVAETSRASLRSLLEALHAATFKPHVAGINRTSKFGRELKQQMLCACLLHWPELASTEDLCSPGLLTLLS